MDLLTRIKSIVLAGRIVYTTKARQEMSACAIEESEVVEAIINASRIAKTLRSRSPGTGRPETLYVIKGRTFANLWLYTKGKITRDEDRETFYVLVSSKTLEHS